MRKKKEYDVDENENDVKAELSFLCDDDKDEVSLETDHIKTQLTLASHLGRSRRASTNTNGS